MPGATNLVAKVLADEHGRARVEAVLAEAKAEAARLSRDAERANARVAGLERALARLQAER
jgi:hypothetical protein